MKKTEKIKSVNAIQGALYQLNGEDEMIVVFDTLIQAIGENGKIYEHEKVYKGYFKDEEGFYRPNRAVKYNVDKLIARIEEVMIINLDHWYYMGNVADLEDPMERLKREWSDNSDHFED